VEICRLCGRCLKEGIGGNQEACNASVEHEGKGKVVPDTMLLLSCFFFRSSVRSKNRDWSEIILCQSITFTIVLIGQNKLAVIKYMYLADYISAMYGTHSTLKRGGGPANRDSY